MRTTLLLTLCLLIIAASLTADAAPRRRRRARLPRSKVSGTPVSEGRWACSDAVLAELGETDTAPHHRLAHAPLCGPDDPDVLLIDQVYIINLARRRDRMTAVTEELKTHELRGVRFDAIDGQTLSEFEVSLFNEKAIRKLTVGLVGNFISHMRVWQDAADHGYARVLIIEDDATFDAPTPIMLLRDRIEELETTDPDWHFAYTGRLSVGETRLLFKDEGMSDHFPERFDRAVSEHILDPGPSEGMWGYMLSETGARAMVDLYKNAGLQYDVDLMIHLPVVRDHLRMYAIDPPITAYNEEDAHSDDSGTSTVTNLLKRGNKLIGNHDYGEAAKRYLRAIELGVQGYERSWVWSNMAFIYDIHFNDPQSARQAFDMALDNDILTPQQRADNLANYCFFHFRHNNFDMAAKKCQKAIDLVPGHAKASANLELVNKHASQGSPLSEAQRQELARVIV